MSAKQECLTMAAVLGVQLVFGGGRGRLYEIEAIAPAGFRFVEGLQHTMLETQNRDEANRVDCTTGALWTSMLDRLEYGLEPCPADCECRDTEEPDAWNSCARRKED